MEYVKDEYKIENTCVATTDNLPSQDTFNDFEQHVSPLDPNMSSVAGYSPVYNGPTTEFNSIVVHQLIQPNNELISNSPLESMSVMDSVDKDSQFLQMVDSSNSQNSVSSRMQLIPQDPQEVEFLITDQETGISYSIVRSEEFLVERCLEDEQLLNSLNPDPLLDSDLLALDENTLKTELNDNMVNSVVVNNYIPNLTVANEGEIDGAELSKMPRRSRGDVEFDTLCKILTN